MTRRCLFGVVLLLVIQGCQPEAAAPPVTPQAQSRAQGPAVTEKPAVSGASEKTDPKQQSEGAARATSGESQGLIVAAASDLRFVFVELQKEFLKDHEQVDLKATFGSSGTLFAQISQQAPLDVFLSADVQYAQKLVDNKSAVPDSLFRYAVGHIVLWVRKESPLQVQELGAKALTDPEVKKVAIANPATAPYGRAAEAALKHLGLYDAVKEKLVLGDNVAQTAQFAETGAADVAIIGLSLASAPAFADKGRFWKFPSDSFPKIEQAGVILQNSKQQALAREFCEFLQSEAAQVIFRKYGFEIPDEKPEEKK